jgi:NADH-quinone oxidoreductase subunit A
MPANYVPIFLFIAVAFAIPGVTLMIAKLARPENPEKVKLMPYECGIDPVDNARGRYTVRFYIVAILFVVFDVETIFLFPWAVQAKALALFGLLEMGIFLGILVVGFIWIWKKGALEWV